MMTNRLWPLIACTLLAAACETPSSPEPDESVDYAAEAQRIAGTSIIVDTHIDAPFRLSEYPADVSASTGGDFDYPRARAGGLNAAVMSIYTPAELEAVGRSREVADALIDLVEGIVASAPDKFAIARSPAEVREHFAKGLLGGRSFNRVV